MGYFLKMDIVNDIEMASAEIILEEKVEKDITVNSTLPQPEDELALVVPKEPEVAIGNVTTAPTKPLSVRPAPIPFSGVSGAKSRGETTRLGRKGKRKIDSSQGTSATKKSKG